MRIVDQALIKCLAQDIASSFDEHAGDLARPQIVQHVESLLRL